MNFVRVLLAVMAMLVGASSVHAQGVSGQGTWETTLLGRDINLNAVAATSADAVYLYDTTLGVTWLRDANVNINNGNGGRMDWNSAMSWANNLVTGSGAVAISDWRLPAMTNIAVPHCKFGFQGPDCSLNRSETSSLFFSSLGNVIDGGTPPNTGSFQNLVASTYWLLDSTSYSDPETNDGAFAFSGGRHGIMVANNPNLFAMAVRSGDVLTPVPEPETYAMLLAGLGLIGAIGRRRRRT